MNDLIPPLGSQGQILAHVSSCLGVITLNRPEALNALTLAMVRDMTVLLRHWATDPASGRGAARCPRPGKGPVFCAGVISVSCTRRRLPRPGPRCLLHRKYRLDHLIHTYAKPTLALMEGFVMGGGMGLSQGAKLRVLTEHSRLAMPGDAHRPLPRCRGRLLPRPMPGHIGGGWPSPARPSPATTPSSGAWAMSACKSQHMPGLVEALCHGDQPSAEHVVATVMERADLAPPSARYRA